MVEKDNEMPKIIVVCGPTGSGKTSLAVQLCKKFNGEIINADSRQVYREMDIGTGKGEVKSEKLKVKSFGVPSAQYLEGVRIHLVNIIEPNNRYTVGQFKINAEEAIADIISRGKVPFIVGGTGMYIDALVDNFQFSSFNFQSISNNQFSIKEKSLEELVKLLEKLDPQALNVVDLKNRRRVEHAIEVCLATGIPFSKQRTKGERKYKVLKLAPLVSLEREKLYEKINKRVDEMIEQGLENEVKSLAEKYGWESEAMTGIGYREFRDESDIEKVKDKIKQDTRNYAKRQMTWFKRDKEIGYIDLKKAEMLVKDFLKK
ncbi:MAG TPA: tRNA (adenosine(37)-N6)-dimethylallyltransferase MiaA [Patescibacteria group bacterium]|nr:tRNA (adenosine(37)-N6)-dimethylallyltransferase MiaA [Patescibacteria group bacterium]